MSFHHCAFRKIEDAGIDLCLVTTACGCTKRTLCHLPNEVSLRSPWAGFENWRGSPSASSAPSFSCVTVVGCSNGQWFKVAIIIIIFNFLVIVLDKRAGA